MKILKILAAFMLLACVSCAKKYGIEERARQQMPVSLDAEIQEFCPGASNLDIQDIKTIYVNDSICLLQFSVLYDNEVGKRRARDYRYIYLIDMIQSRMERRPVFLEQFRNILCMPDELIRQCCKDIKESGESVYESSIGSCYRVNKPYDNPKK